MRAKAAYLYAGTFSFDDKIIAYVTRTCVNLCRNLCARIAYKHVLRARVQDNYREHSAKDNIPVAYSIFSPYALKVVVPISIPTSIVF